MADLDIVRPIVDLRDRTLQKSRIAFGNRVSAATSGSDTVSPEVEALIARWERHFDELETEADKDIAKLVKDVPIVQHMTALRGIGPMLAAKIVALIDIHRTPSISALWRYSGYAVQHGKRERSEKGKRRAYNARLKTVLYQVGTSFLRSGSPYRRLYDDARAFYAHRTLWTPEQVAAARAAIYPPLPADQEWDPTSWSDGRQHMAAMAKMEKIFLAHLWERWRTLEGLDTRPPYAHAKLAHAELYLPSEFGWPDL